MSTSASPSQERAELYLQLDPEYPRPQLRRRRWLSLDGRWSFARGEARHPGEVDWAEEIVVPYPPESPLSGLRAEGELPVVWYRREIRIPPEWRGQRIRLNFGAVDYDATVWIDGHLVARHRGGHTPFSAEVDHLVAGGTHELVVRADDAPADFEVPRGKQDWLPGGHSIWYPRTTGIWQSVWAEPLGTCSIGGLRVVPDVASFSLGLEAEIEGRIPEPGIELEIELLLAGETLWHSRHELDGGRLRLTVGLPDPGIDDARKRLLWSPESPTLMDLVITLRSEGEVLDRVESYVGLRSVEVRAGRFHLNGLPYFQRLVLDQGYWPESHLAPPSADALRRDVALAKSMGFNGVRKHQKLEDPRYLYWADRLGLLVWSELPSAYAFSDRAVSELTSTWMEAVRRDHNHPSLVAWVPFNESWGVPDLPTSVRQRDAVLALYHLTRALDGTRPVIDNDGWEHQRSDLFTVHDYDHDPAGLTERYGDADRWRASLVGFRPGGRSLQLGEPEEVPPAPIISEFGGIRLAGGADGWGYSEAEDGEELLDRLRHLVRSLASSPVVAGYCYTQFSDTFQEQNGLLRSDRTPKVPLDSLAEVIRKGGRD